MHADAGRPDRLFARLCLVFLMRSPPIWPLLGALFYLFALETLLSALRLSQLDVSPVQDAAEPGFHVLHP